MTRFDLLKLRSIAIYLVGGVASAGVDILIIKIALANGLSDSMSVTSGFLCGLVFNYCYHLLLTFKSAFSFSSLLKYGIVVLFNYALTMVIVHVSVGVFGLSVIAGKVISLPIIAVVGFVLGKIWIFKSLEKTPPVEPF